MNSKLIKILASVCFGLCLMVAVEWLYAYFMQGSLLASISAETHQDYKTDELPEIELSTQPEDAYVDLVSRPLFIKGRKPVEEPGPEVAQVAVKPDTFDWQLSGVYSTQKTVSALFSRVKTKVPKDNYRKKTLGQEIDGWKLTVINKDKVMLRLGSNQKELLLRKPKPKTIAPQRGNNPLSNLPTPFNVPAPPAASATQAPPPASAPSPAPAPGLAPFAFPEPDEDMPDETVDETIDDTTEDTPEIIQ